MGGGEKPTVSVIIPTKNEQHTITGVIKGVSPFADEVLVVDGHSTDATRAEVGRTGAKFILDHGRGKGDGIKVARTGARGDILVFIDGDGSHVPHDIEKMVNNIKYGHSDLVIASRVKGGSDELYGNLSGFVRGAGAGLTTMIINWRWGTHLTDIHNGFRAVKRDVIRDLDLRTDDFDIEQEMVLKALKKGYRVVEIASHENERKFGCSKLSVCRKAPKFLWSLLRNIL